MTHTLIIQHKWPESRRGVDHSMVPLGAQYIGGVWEYVAPRVPSRMYICFNNNLS
jgi:hypothetical protein